MQMHIVNEEDRQIAVNVFTAISPKDDKERIYAELHYWDKPAHRIYNKVFPAAKYPLVMDSFHALYNREITPDKLFNGNWLRAPEGR